MTDVHDVLAVAWRDALNRVETIAAVLATIDELDRVKPRDGGWLATVEAISVRDYGIGLANLGSVDLGVLYAKMLEQLKAAPAGAGGAAVAPKDPIEDGDGIPD